MADKPFSVDYSAIERLEEQMRAFGEGSGQIVDEVLHGEGAQLIKQNITPLIPVSERSWSGKKTAASRAMPGAFAQENGSLSVTIAARGTYGYLYFPDDGSNTKRHAGDLQFMKRGTEAATERIVDKCVGKLIENFESMTGG